MRNPRTCISCGKPSGDEIRCLRCCWREAAPNQLPADFEAACNRAADDLYITTAECNAAVEAYRREWGCK